MQKLNTEALYIINKIFKWLVPKSHAISLGIKIKEI